MSKHSMFLNSDLKVHITLELHLSSQPNLFLCKGLDNVTCNVPQNLPGAINYLCLSPLSSNTDSIRLQGALTTRVSVCSHAENNSLLLASKGILLLLLWQLVSCKIKPRNSIFHQSLSLLPKAGGCSKSAQPVPQDLSTPLWNAKSTHKCWASSPDWPLRSLLPLESGPRSIISGWPIITF